MPLPLKALAEAPKARAAMSLGKLTIAIISSAAALVSVLGTARSYGLLGNPGTTRLTVHDFGAAWVGVAPTADTVTAIGDTIHLAATVTDKTGSVLVGPLLVWSSDDPTVASVGADGTVIARGTGTTSIVVSVGDKVARSRVTVLQVVAAVRVNGDSVVSLDDGEEAPITARGIDARGHPVGPRPTSWKSGNSEIITVDSTGLAVAKFPGATTISATVDGISSSTPVNVLAVPASLDLVAGASQRAPAAATLPQRIAVQVMSRRGRPVSGVAVRFRAEDPSGILEPAVAITEADGRARTAWTLGAMPGRQRLYASVDRVDSALVVVAEAEPIAANTRAAQIGAAPSAVAATTLPDEVGLRLTDSTGRALGDVPVSWVALDGGSIGDADVRTDSLGEARARWTLGNTSGSQRVRVRIGSGRVLAPVTLKAIATAGPLAQASIASGDNQKAAVNAELKKPIVIRAVDKLGNPVPDARLTLQPQQGTVGDSVAVTDSTGTATVRWTLARSVGAHRLTARVEGLERALHATATALPAAAANLALTSDAVRGSPGKKLAAPVIATVTDSYGNPVADAIVSFTAKSGSVTPARIATDAKGRAKTQWTLGRSGGEQAVVAVVKGHDVRGTLTVQVSGTTAATPVKKLAAPKPAAKTPAKGTTSTTVQKTKSTTKRPTKSTTKPPR